MAKSIKIGNAVLCEYVAQGNRNKFMLVNAYSGDVLVSKFPANLMFGLYMEFFLPDPTEEVKINCHVKLEKEEIFVADIALKSSEPNKANLIILPQMRFEVDANTTLNIELKGDGFRKTKALSKKIFEGDVQ